MASPLCSSLIFLALLSISSSEAKDFLVGGSSDSWKIPPSTTDSLNKWAETTRFQVGDSLVWKYDGEKDSVLEVTRESYMSCNTSSPVAEHKDGTTKVVLDRQGPYYFISGAEGACDEGEKLIVVVMAPRIWFHSFSPAASPVEYDGPTAAPTSGSSEITALGRGLAAALIVVGIFGMVV